MHTLPIAIHATNVELTDERRALIVSRLAPLGRLVGSDENCRINVVMRYVSHRYDGARYCVSVKLLTDAGNHVAVAIEPFLGRALTKTRTVIQRSVSSGANVYDRRARRERPMIHSLSSLMTRPFAK